MQQAAGRTSNVNTTIPPVSLASAMDTKSWSPLDMVNPAITPVTAPVSVRTLRIMPSAKEKRSVVSVPAALNDLRNKRISGVQRAKQVIVGTSYAWGAFCTGLHTIQKSTHTKTFDSLKHFSLASWKV